MMRGAVAALAMLCAQVAPAVAQDDGPEVAAKATPTGVHQVFSGGFWTDGKVDGHYRIVVVQAGFEHVSHRVFIQWIAIDPDNQDLKLIRTVPVVEISELSGIVTDVRPQFGPNSPPRFTIVLQGRDGKKRTRLITATADGKYTIK